MTETTDVTGTLAELERKLRELERELTSLGRRRAGADAAPTRPGPSPTPASGPSPTPAGGPSPTPASGPSPTAASGPSPTPASGPSPTPASGRLVDEAIEPALAGQARATPSEAAAPPRPPGGGVRAAEPAEQDEARRPTEAPRPTEAQLAGLAELRRFRDRLERFAKELAVEYDTLLGRVMTGLFSTSQSAGTAAPDIHTLSSATSGAPSWQPPPRMTSAAPGAPRSPMPTPPSVAPAAPVAPQPPPVAAVPQPPVAPQPPPVAAPRQRPSEDESLFEGHVELGAGPFYDIGALSAFERRLAGLPNVISAAVRRFEASHAVVDVRLSAPVALVGELRRTTDTDFSVREIASGRILLTFDD